MQPPAKYQVPRASFILLLMISHLGRKLDCVLRSRVAVLPQQRASEARPSNVAGELIDL
jgi:hypothetical protein